MVYIHTKKLFLDECQNTQCIFGDNCKFYVMNEKYLYTTDENFEIIEKRDLFSDVKKCN